VQSGTLTEMRHLTRTTIEAHTRPSRSPAWSGCPASTTCEATDGRVRFAVDGDHLDDAVRVLGQFEIRSLTSHPPTLEELMLRHYGDELAPRRQRQPGERTARGGGAMTATAVRDVTRAPAGSSTVAGGNASPAPAR
jgi:ABC-2 type transport system ATP-binding protein